MMQQLSRGYLRAIGAVQGLKGGSLNNLRLMVSWVRVGSFSKQGYPNDGIEGNYPKIARIAGFRMFPLSPSMGPGQNLLSNIHSLGRQRSGMCGPTVFLQG